MSKFRKQAGDGTILVIIRQLGDAIYVEPKPGDVLVKSDHHLHLTVVNLTQGDRNVKFEFELPFDGKKKTYRWSVGQGATVYEAVLIPATIFKGVPQGINVIAVGYLVTVDDVVIDPDVKIQR